MNPRDTLEAWFASYGSDSQLEIESRIRGGVSEGVYRYVLRKFLEANCWESDVKEEETLDVSFAGAARIRGTYWMSSSAGRGGDGGGGGGGGVGVLSHGAVPRYLRKEKEEDPCDFEHVDKATGLTLPIRMSCSSEVQLDWIRAGGHEVQHVRYKRRHSFNRKNEFQYDLTEVRSGGTMEEARTSRSVEYEIELEWIGQNSVKAGKYDSLGGAKHLAEKYLLKVADMCMLVAAARKIEGGSSN